MPAQSEPPRQSRQRGGQGHGSPDPDRKPAPRHFRELPAARLAEDAPEPEDTSLRVTEVAVRLTPLAEGRGEAGAGGP